MNGCPGGATAGGADALAEADADALADGSSGLEAPVDGVAGVLDGGDDRGHEVGDRANRPGQHKAECNQESEKDPAAPDVGRRSEAR